MPLQQLKGRNVKVDIGSKYDVNDLLFPSDSSVGDTMRD